MAFEANEYGRSVAAPGLIFPDQPTATESRCMAENADSEGGFPVFAKKGEDVKAYASKPVTDGYFLGIAQRIVTRDEYKAGTPVTVVTTGHIWVKTGGNVKSGDELAIDENGKWVAFNKENNKLTAVQGGKFLTSASEGAYAVVGIK